MRNAVIVYASVRLIPVQRSRGIANLHFRTFARSVSVSLGTIGPVSPAGGTGIC